MVASLAQVGETLVVPESRWISIMMREAFDNMLLKKTGHNYDSYGLVSRYFLGLGAKRTPKEVELEHNKCLESRLD